MTEWYCRTARGEGSSHESRKLDDCDGQTDELISGLAGQRGESCQCRDRWTQLPNYCWEGRESGTTLRGTASCYMLSRHPSTQSLRRGVLAIQSFPVFLLSVNYEDCGNGQKRGHRQLLSGQRDLELELENCNTQGYYSRSIWTYLTAIPCCATNTSLCYKHLAMLQTQIREGDLATSIRKPRETVCC